MRIVSLEPFCTDLIISLGLKESLVGVSSRCDSDLDLPRVTLKGSDKDHLFCTEEIEYATLRSLSPEIIIGAHFTDSSPEATLALQEKLSSHLGAPVAYHSYAPTTMEGVYQGIEELGKKLELAQKGRDISSRMKAQFMDWGDNFYERMKNKRVTVITSLEPFALGGRWIPDMIQLASAQSQVPSTGKPHPFSHWNEVLQFKPDVLLITPEGKELLATAKTFTYFEKLPHWEDIPAVKRGEVFFTDGIHHFHRPSLKLIESMAVLISAIAGFESGYITPRDSFYKLRWLELHRHKFA